MQDEEIQPLLSELQEGREGAFDRLVSLVYDQLVQLAERLGQQRDGTLRPTALVHEVFLRFSKQPEKAWEGREHLLAVSARAMRQILADHARRKNALKRGGQVTRITLSEAFWNETPGDDSGVDALDLHEALESLAKLDSRQAEIVELHYLGGMTCAEVAKRLSLGLRTVEFDLSMARSFLRKQLSSSSDGF